MKWRTEKLDVDCYDFEYLREWRIKDGVFDFSKFPKGDMIVVATNTNMLNQIVVKFDMKFTPYVDYYNEEIEPDWTESFKENGKGLPLMI